MTDEAEGGEAADDHLAFEVMEIDNEHGLAVVRFANPYSGGPEDAANVDAVKQVRVPFLANGSIDQDAWGERLRDQARGVLRRMEAARQVPVPDNQA